MHAENQHETMMEAGDELLAKPWAYSSEEVLSHFGVSLDKGLEQHQVRKLRKRYGANRLRKIERKSSWQILLNQFKSLIVILLSVAAVLSFAFKEWVDAGAIAAVIFINTVIGFFMELKATRSMESLRRLEQVTARVHRQGRIREIPAQNIVPGDIIVLEGGDIVSADLRLVQTSKLQADESVLTGESVPVSKHAEPVAQDTLVADRTNMLFKGTAVTRGSGEAVVVGTGMNTELGQISALVEQAEEAVTPLEKRLDQLGRKLLWVTLLIIAVVAAVGIARGKEVMIMIETAIALAVAAVPEGLPIVATIALARGMIRMARQNALINHLAAVETLGGTSVICTDKTGTLTENKMTVTRIILDTGDITVTTEGNQTVGKFIKDENRIKASEDEIFLDALEIGALCNNASLKTTQQGVEAIGDPLEAALLIAAAKAGIKRDNLVKRLPEEREEAFDSEVKMMATFHKNNRRYRVAVKGAPEAVLAACSQSRTAQGDKKLDEKGRNIWNDLNTRMAEQGLRVLALAEKAADTTDVNPYEDLTLIGLVGMVDPPRQGVREAVGLCRDAGIRAVMVTGDQPKTAYSIASQIGLIEKDQERVIAGTDVRAPGELSEDERERSLRASIFARVSPKQKLDLIDLHQQAGSVVAMTGDGVNDAPALKKADIGVAMGQRGTQVAREAADMVLKDDAFSTILVAVEQGRIIFNNIRKFVLYLLSCNVSEVMIVFMASLVNAPLPILPLQILFLNLVTDVFPALALGVGEGDPAIMRQKPRDPKEPILTSRHWLAIIVYGLLITVSVLCSFALAFILLAMDSTQAVTISFLTLAFAQLWHIFNMRQTRSRFLRNEIVRNRFIWGAIALCTALLIASVYVPVLSTVLGLINPGFKGWILVILMSLIPCVAGQIFKAINEETKKTEEGRSPS